MANQVLVDPADLTRFTTDIFECAGMPREDAEIEADVLVWANLRGVDSHGVLADSVVHQERRRRRVQRQP